MTWRELKNFINKNARNDKNFLDNNVNLYDFKDGEEYDVNTTELSCGNDEVEDDSETNWVPYLSINDKEFDNENKTEEASIN